MQGMTRIRRSGSTEGPCPGQARPSEAHSAFTKARCPGRPSQPSRRPAFPGGPLNLHIGQRATEGGPRRASRGSGPRERSRRAWRARAPLAKLGGRGAGDREGGSGGRGRSQQSLEGEGAPGKAWRARALPAKLGGRGRSRRGLLLRRLSRVSVSTLYQRVEKVSKNYATSKISLG